MTNKKKTSNNSFLSIFQLQNMGFSVNIAPSYVSIFFITSHAQVAKFTQVQNNFVPRAARFH